MTRCVVEGCNRRPPFPDQARCEEHRLPWKPNPVRWLEWTREHRNAKDLSGRAA